MHGDCAALFLCCGRSLLYRTAVGIEAGRFRTLAKMSGSGKLLAPRSHLWPILAGSRELGSNPLDKKRAFLRMIDLASQFEETAPGLSATRNRPPEPTENSVRINPHPCGTLIADLVDALSLLASTAESKDWQSLPRPVVECIQVQGVRVAKESGFD